MRVIIPPLCSSGDHNLKKAPPPLSLPERVFDTMTDPLNGWTGTYSGSLGKRPTTSGDGFGGSLSVSHDEWIATNAKGADMELVEVIRVLFPFGCMLCQDKEEMVFMVTAKELYGRG